MNLKHALAAAAVCALAAPAFAADQTIDLSSGAASFTATSPVLDGGDDVITFTNLAAGTYDFLLTVSAQSITGLSANLNGQAVDMLSFGRVTLGYLDSSAVTPLVLSLTGMPNAQALYSVDMSVTAVPEPGTYAMLLAGLAAVGFMARRRQA